MLHDWPDELSAEKFEQIITTSRVRAADVSEAFGGLPLAGCFLADVAVDPLVSTAIDMARVCGLVVNEGVHDVRVATVGPDRAL